MKSNRLRGSLLLTSLGFVLAIGVSIFMFVHFRAMLQEFGDLNKISLQKHTESLMDDNLAQYNEINDRETVLLQRMQNTLLVSVIIIIIFMFFHVWLNYTVVLGSLRETEVEDRTRLMLDATPMACSLWDTEGNILDCNQETLKILGITDKSEFMEHHCEFNPEHQPNGETSRSEELRLHKEVIKKGHICFEWIYCTKAGKPLPVEIDLVRVPWRNGWRISLYARDLSGIKEAETHLKRIQSLVEASPDMNIYLETNGNIKYMNPSVSRVSGYSPEELQKTGLALMFSPNDFKLLNEEYIPAALAKVLASFEMTIVTRDNKKLIYSFTAVPVQMYDGNAGVGLQGKDISELKRMYQELEIARDQAERALESEIQYNKAKGDFLSRVSHELRTPINAIVGLTTIAKSNNKKMDTAQNYAKIKIATERLLELVNDILDMTGFDTGSFDFSSAPFSLKKAINSVLDDINARVLIKNQTFTASIDDAIYKWVFSDERRLKQVLINLLSNAVKFTPVGGSIKFSAQMLADNGNECTLRFDVHDTGIGIPPEALERLGQLFEQADNSITREYGGMGLGLSLTKRIVETMNGQIWVSSEFGKGSCFSCEVRLGVVEPQEETGLTTEGSVTGNGGLEAPAENPAFPDLTGKRVMIVDDVDINREILIMLLEETGAKMDGAEHGADAVKLFLENKYDLILIDLHMPIMDGFTAAKIIRASTQPWSKTIPIIAVSAESSGELKSKCLEAGITDHITKPVDAVSLLKMISRCMPKS